MHAPRAPQPEVFPGDSEMSARMCAHDWTATPLGDPAAWPAALTVPLQVLLTSRFPMWLGWGPDLAFFYNDAYAPTLGTKHADALGRPMRKVWGEIFDELKSRITSVMRDGIATWDKALMLLLERSGYPEETYHTFSYSPLRGDSGAVEGLMCVVAEETEYVLGERRLEALRNFATALLSTRTRGEVVAAVDAALSPRRRDFPFAFLRLFDDAGYAGSGIAGAEWPLDRLRESPGPLRVALAGFALDPPRGAWDVPAREALLVPIVKPGQEAPVGALVLGLNPYRPGDPGLDDIAQLFASQIGGALVRVDTRAREAAEIERLRQLFEQSPSFIAVLRGAEHRFELVNPRYAQLVGHRPVIGKTVTEALPEIARGDFLELVDQVRATGEPYVAQSMPIDIHRHPGAAPETAVVDFVYQPILDDGGAVTGIFIQGVDVTSAHDATLALRESEARFRTLSEAMPNHVWTSRPDGQLDWFNDQVYAYAGAEPGSLDGNGWTRMVHPDDLPGAGRQWAAALASGDTYETEFRLRRADGVYRWHIARAVPIRGDDRAIGTWIGTNTDIDDQKAAAQTLTDLNTRLAAEVAVQARERERLWENSEDMLVVLDRRGVFQAVSPAATKILGWLPAELIGRPVLDFVLVEDQEETESAFSRAFHDPLPTYQNRFRHRDGSSRWMSWVAALEGDFVYATGRHITAEREAAETLALAEDQLRQAQKMEAVGQLTGGLAHDFNNLLTGISGSLELMQMRMAQGRLTELDRYINAAQASARRAAALTHRLLAFSRRQTLDPKAVNINRLVADMEELIRRTVGPEIRVEVLTAGGLWPTLVDPHQLDNALLNLCINARDAMPEGGRLTIETANRWLDERAARERELPSGQYVSLCVSDTGSGMTPEVIARAFEPFYTTKPIGEGTGLGLSMIYGFARQSGGQVRIYSEVGDGTLVCLYLPRGAAEDTAADAALAAREAVPPGTGETVLVIDDEPGVRMLVVEILEDLGYVALEAADGPAGLRALETDPGIDLLITDVGLPGGMNGRQVADAARVLRPELKVLFITGYAENAVVGNGHLDRGMHIIAKPFAMDALAQRIKEIIDRP